MFPPLLDPAHDALADDIEIEKPPEGGYRFLARGAPITPRSPAARDGGAMSLDYAVSVMCDGRAYANRNSTCPPGPYGVERRRIE